MNVKALTLNMEKETIEISQGKNKVELTPFDLHDILTSDGFKPFLKLIEGIYYYKNDKKTYVNLNSVLKTITR